MPLPCGRCIGCRIDKAQQWAQRCLHESQLYESNCFLTLTYGQPNYPPREEDQERVLSTSRHVDKREEARELSTSAPNGLEGPNIARVGNSRSEGDFDSLHPVGSRGKLDRSASCPTPEGGGGGCRKKIIKNS